MAEIKLTRIRSIYGDVKGLLSQIPDPSKQSMVKEFTVQTFNCVVDELSQIAETDYSNCKIPESQRSNNWHDSFPSIVVRAQIGRLVSHLEEEFSFGKNQATSSPSIAIFNRNNNEVSVQINYTINDLIEKIEEDEGKTQLRELRDELEKSDKNWEKIKSILIWILNFSKDLFLEVLPIILQNKI
ncbi:MAG: hypothetical protein ACD_7C00489G0004 [uncultured bacterium]|nr:MAG: hypothetical protein ACD_7C00489G0004 [uncultured bacterium]